MSFDDETLMAYADGELEPALRERIEQAMRTDPAVAEAVERHRLLRADVFAAFAGVLDEPVPQRLQPVRPAVAQVRIDALASAGATPLPARWSWQHWGAVAASLAAGVLAGVLGWQQAHPGAGASMFGRDGGALVAQGALADALSQRLAQAPQAGEVAVGLSFRSKDGNYCRSFSLGASAGLACREQGQWRIPVLAETAGKEDGAYRQAGTAMPAAVLDAIDARIEGAALDARAEREAQARGWQAR